MAWKAIILIISFGLWSLNLGILVQGEHLDQLDGEWGGMCKWQKRKIFVSIYRSIRHIFDFADNCVKPNQYISLREKYWRENVRTSVPL